MIDEDTTPVEVSAEGSLVDLIQQDLTELSENETVIIPIKGHERSGLAIKYRLPTSGKELDEIARKVERQDKDRWYRNINTAIDTIIALCEGLYVKPQGIDDYVMLDPQGSGTPVRFDSRLADIVNLPADATARTVLRKVFGNHELAIVAHAEKLNRWLTDTKADIETEFWQMGG